MGEGNRLEESIAGIGVCVGEEKQSLRSALNEPQAASGRRLMNSERDAPAMVENRAQASSISMSLYQTSEGGPEWIWTAMFPVRGMAGSVSV